MDNGHALKSVNNGAVKHRQEIEAPEARCLV
jgi:hypothetical protein